MEQGRTSPDSPSGSNSKKISERNTTDQELCMEVTDLPTEEEEKTEYPTVSRIKVILHETGMEDGHEGVLDPADDTPNTQEKELNVEKDLAGCSSQPSTEACNSGEEKDDSTSLSFAAAIEQYHEPDRTLYVYKNSTVGSDVMINVVSLTSLKEGTGAEVIDTSEAAAVQPGSHEDMDTEPQEEEAGVERDSTASKATKDIPEYRCDQCDFTTKKTHLRLSHEVLHAVPDEKQLFYCSKCSYTTPQRFNLKTHVKTHFDIKEMDPSELFKCPECDYVSMYKYDLQTHSKKHDPEKQYRCFHCDFTSIYRHSLLHHISSKHHGVRPFQCSLCSYSATRKQDLETHMFKHKKQKRYKCTECDYETTYNHCLKSHMHIHNGDNPFKCTRPGCTFSTNSKSNLNSHVTRHSKRIQCESCGFEASSAKTLTNHICLETKKRKEINKRISMAKVPPPSKKEDGKLEFTCQECGYVSKSKHSMKRHSQIHDAERERPDKVHQCKQCNYVSAYKSSLTRHMARHSLVKPFKCGHCDYSAITMTQMHTHIAKHTGIKQYSCDLCTYSTANKQHLTNHMSKHSNLRYKCNACGHITAWKDRMRVHLKQHEQGRIVGRSVKSSLQSHGSTGLQVLSGEGGQLVTTDGQVLQVLNVIGNEGIQHIEGSETLVVMNQLADRIQEEFIAIGEEEDQGEAISQGQEQSDVQNKDDGIAVGGEEIIGNQQEQIIESEAQLVSQGESEDGTLMIVTDHDGSDLHLRLTGAGLQSSKVGSLASLEMCNERPITSTAVGLGNATATVTEISGEAT